MGRYIIIDSHENAIPRMGIYGKVLTAEETESILKNIWDQAVESTRDNCDVTFYGSVECDYDAVSKEWDEFKKQL